MTDTNDSNALRDQLLRDASEGECLPLAHVDHVARRMTSDSLAARQSLLIRTVRSLIDDGLMVVGNIVGASDERVEPWDMSLDDAMALIHDEYVVNHDNGGLGIPNLVRTDRAGRAGRSSARSQDVGELTAFPSGGRISRENMTDEHGASGDDGAGAMAQLREHFLRDLRGDCLPMAHFDYVAQRLASDSISDRQALVLTTVRSLLLDKLVVIGRIAGGSDERVDAWDLTQEDVVALFHDKYIVHHDDQNWVFGIWFELTERGERAAEALGTEGSGD